MSLHAHELHYLVCNDGSHNFGVRLNNFITIVERDTRKYLEFKILRITMHKAMKE